MKLTTCLPILILAIIASGCSSSNSTQKKDAALESNQLTFLSGLAAAPSDTFFALSSNGALSPELSNALYGALASYGAVECSVEGVSLFGNSVFLHNRESSDFIRAVGAVISKKVDLNNPDWRVVGLAPQPEVVAYAVGVAPVVRMTLDNPQRFAEVLDAAEQKVGFAVKSVEASGIKIRYFSEHKHGSTVTDQMLVSIVGNELVVAHFPQAYSKIAAFKPAILGVKSSELGLRLAEPSYQSGFSPNSFSGFFSIEKFVNGIAVDSAELSSNLLFTYFSAGPKAINPQCRQALKSYNVTNKDVVFYQSHYGDGRFKLEVQLPVDASTSSGLVSAGRAPVVGSVKSAEELRKHSALIADFNGNLYQVLAVLSKALDDEADTFSLCKGAQYQPGALQMLMAPMRGLLEKVEGLKLAAALQSRKSDAAISVNSSEPEKLLQGFALYLGKSAPEGTPVAGELSKLQGEGGFSLPVNEPIYTYHTEKYIDFAFGESYKNYLSLHEMAYKDGVKATTYPLFHLDFSGATSTSKIHTLSEMAAHTTVDAKVKEEAPVIIDIDFPLNSELIKKTVLSKKWQESAQNKCLNR